MCPHAETLCFGDLSLPVNSAHVSGGLAWGSQALLDKNRGTRQAPGRMQGASPCPLGLGMGLAAAELVSGGWQLGSPTWGNGGWWGMPGARAAPWSMWEGWSAAPKGDVGIGRETGGWGSRMFLPCMRPERWQVFGKQAFSAVCNN